MCKFHILDPLFCHYIRRNCYIFIFVDYMSSSVCNIPDGEGALDDYQHARMSSKPTRKRGRTSTSRNDLLAVTYPFDVMMKVNKKAFPQDMVCFSKLGYNNVFDESPSNLFKVLSLLYFYGLSILSTSFFVCK